MTVAVVSWNTRELLIRCLNSLAAEVRDGRAQVWVVDNGSSDGSAQAAREQAPWAQVVEAGENLGFGRAVNLVARRTASEWLACANADIALEPGALAAMLATGAAAGTGCVAPRLVLADGTAQHSVYPLPTLPFTVAFNLGVQRLAPSLGDRMCLEGYWNPDRPRTVPWAIGAFLLLRREAFERVGGFDERQWMYAEDLDLGWRLHDASWATRYEPRARVLHEAGAATERAFGDRRVERYMRATYAVVLRRRGPARTRLTAVVNVGGAAARIAWMAPLAAFWSRWRGPLAAARMWLRLHLDGLRAAAAGAGGGAEQ
ncbi:MAG TPA: glycosyltransferase family 2 protein [Solirubrobacteraceae bacterium]|nr:glycosyltransferase family 2 protein [Solirubrobacteraceae bacterium]